MLEHTPYSVNDWKALVQERLEVNRYRDISVPTLMLAGSLTEDHPLFTTQSLDDLLPNNRIAMLEGETHSVNLTSPDLVAQEAAAF